MDLIIDGSVHSNTEHAVEATTAVSEMLPAGEVNPDVTVRIRTQDLVVTNPTSMAVALAQGPLPAHPFTVDAEGIVADQGPVHTFIPWYYMMDENAVRPYDMLFWDTGTAWYKGFADEAWTDYVGLLAPVPSPVPSATQALPDARLRTAVEEIEVRASVDVLLHNALAPTGESMWQRGVLPAATGVHRAALGTDQPPTLVVPASGANLLGLSRDADASQMGLEPGEQANVAGTLAPVVASPVSAAAFAAGTLLVGFALYHLIKKNAILKNKVRSAIAEQVLSNPGNTITEIAAAVGVTHQTASYHLRLLQEHGLVIGVERGNKRLYFRNDGSFNQEERGLVAVLRDPESMRVLQLIRENPWIMKNEAAMALGVSRNTLNWHLQKLLAAGLVSEARENGHCFLFCNKQANSQLMGTVTQKVEERKALLPATDLPTGVGPGLDGNGVGHPA